MMASEKIYSREKGGKYLEKEKLFVANEKKKGEAKGKNT